ncbi:MAG: NAD(P)-dependent oxidoreductase [Varibaculum sp.]|nr:NAD(P)-dependent oxidoreductase [Varibaculum sp.]
MSKLQVSVAPQWHFDLGREDTVQQEWDLRGEPPAEHFDILLAPPLTTPNDLIQARKVGARLLQLGSIGYDPLIGQPVPDGLQVANAAGVYEAITAEHTLGLLLTGMRDYRRAATSKDTGKWDYFFVDGLTDARVLLIGVGGVGAAITERLEPFEVDLVRFATHTRTDRFGAVHGMDELDKYLPTADAIIVVVPLNNSTRGLLGEEVLSALPDGAVVVNVARGPVADTDALLRHAHRLRLVLDVTDPEPLPQGHPLFDAAYFLTAHIGGASKGRDRRMRDLLNEQIDIMLRGGTCKNLIKL